MFQFRFSHFSFLLGASKNRTAKCTKFKHSTILRNLRVSLIVEAGDQIHPFAVFQLGDDDLFAIIGCREDLKFLIPSLP